MRKVLAILAAALIVFGGIGYTAGLFTSETAQRESCAVCRATRYTGHRYGFPFEKIEESALSLWYQKVLDPEHGRNAAHAHNWQPSGCPVYAAPGIGDFEATCPSIAPIFFLKPETELAVLQAAPDNKTRLAVIESLNVPNRSVALQRVKLLVEFVYVYQPTTSWSSWWQKNASSFGMRGTPRPVARR